MDGLFRKLLVDHFSSDGDIEAETLKSKLFTEDVPTGILIETVTKWTPTQTENRPAVLIKRGKWTNQIAGLFGGLKSVDPSTLNPTRVRFWQGEHSFICISRAAAEADILGAEVARYFMHYAEELRKHMHLHRLNLTGLSELSKIREAKDSFAVIVSLQYKWEEVFSTHHKIDMLPSP